VNFVLGKGVARDKLIMGIPTYGKTFKLRNNNNNGVGAPAYGGGTQHYYTICQLVMSGEYTHRWEYEQRVPYAFSGSDWVGYDDIESVTEKAYYINQHQLGGAMFWSIDSDDHRNICGNGHHPLITTVYNIVRR
jgi:chitinase